MAEEAPEDLANVPAPIDTKADDKPKELSPTGSIGTITTNMQNLSAAVQQITKMVEGESPEWADRLKARIAEITSTTGHIVKTAVDFNNRYQKASAPLNEVKINQLMANLGVEVSRFEKLALAEEGSFLNVMRSAVLTIKNIGRKDKLDPKQKSIKELEACFRKTKCARSSMFDSMIQLGVLNEQLKKYVQVLQIGLTNIYEVEKAMEEEFRAMTELANENSSVNRVSLQTVKTTLSTALQRAKGVAQNEIAKLNNIHDAIKMELIQFKSSVSQLDEAIDSAREILDSTKVTLLMKQRKDLVPQIESLVEVLLGIAFDPVFTNADGVEAAKQVAQLPYVVDDQTKDLVLRLTDRNEILSRIDLLTRTRNALNNSWSSESLRGLEWLNLSKMNLQNGTSHSDINAAIDGFWSGYMRNVSASAQGSSFDYFYVSSSKGKTAWMKVIADLNEELEKSGSGTKNLIKVKFDGDGDLRVGLYGGDLLALWFFVSNIKASNFRKNTMEYLVTSIQKVYRQASEFEGKALTMALILKKVSGFTDAETWDRVSSALVPK